jgi:hypothetical protein
MLFGADPQGMQSAGANYGARRAAGAAKVSL